MFKKGRVIFASEDLIPTIIEDLQLQFQTEYKVTTEKRASGGAEIKLSKREFLALVGGKISKLVYLSAAPNGKITCEVFGSGLGALIVPVIIALVLLFIPVIQILGLVVLGIIIHGIIAKNKLTERIFTLVQESADRNIKTLENKPEEAAIVCPNCKTVNEGSGFCSECGTKLK